MNAIRVIALNLLCLCQICMASPMKVLVDPGHGGKDSGATSNGLYESELVLKISKILLNKLNSDPRFEADLSRGSEQFFGLSKRVSKAHSMGADVFISIHANWSPDKRARGLEVYFQNQLPLEEETLYLASLENGHDGHMGAKDSSPVTPHPLNQSFSSTSGDVRNILQDLYRNRKVSKSAELSKQIAKSWKGLKKRPENTIRQAPFFVVSKAEIPAVLVEVGFVSNNKEAKKLKTSSYQNLIADSLYQGLIRYKDSMDIH
jgi:N-acetylmuramoyl-L-alanine amidase